MPSKAFLATSALVVLTGVSSFLYVVNSIKETNLPSDASTSIASSVKTSNNGSNAHLTPPSIIATDTKDFTPDSARCPTFLTRTTATNGPGWLVRSEKSLCLTLEYPDTWRITSNPTGMTIEEPTGHEGEYFETTYIGELSGVVMISFSNAGSWSPEPKNFTRRSPSIFEKDVSTYFSSVASYRLLFPDRAIADIEGYAPPKDQKRRDIVKKIMESIDFQQADATVVKMRPYVN